MVDIIAPARGVLDNVDPAAVAAALDLGEVVVGDGLPVGGDGDGLPEEGGDGLPEEGGDGLPDGGLGNGLPDGGLGDGLPDGGLGDGLPEDGDVGDGLPGEDVVLFWI